MDQLPLTPQLIEIPDYIPRISTNYTPRKLQYELHQQLRRFSVLVAHRRFGKTVFCINHLIDRALRCNLPIPRYAYIAPTYGQAKRVVWDYLKTYTAMIPGVTVNEAELRVDLPANNARIMLLSAENPTSLKGIYLDGCVMDEYAEMNPTAFREVIRPTLSDRKGWVIFIGTPKGQNNFWELYQDSIGVSERSHMEGFNRKDWYGKLFKASETGIIDAAELASAKASMTPEEYDQEFEVSFSAGLLGAYFAKELTAAENEKRIGVVPYDKHIPVDTYWDLGTNDLAAVWFVQSVRGDHRVIDYYEVCGSSIPDVMQVLQKKPYLYGDFVLPHDAAARDFSTGKSQEQVFRNNGAKRLRIIPRVGTKREGINAARMIMGSCRWDAVKCAQGLKALANYQRKWNAKNNVYEESPLHNWACFTEDTLVLTRYGKQQISKLPSIGEVLTPWGWKQYQNPRQTLRDAPLVRVTFEDGTSVRCTPDHLFLTENGWRSAEHLNPNTPIQSALTQLPNTSMVSSIGSLLMPRTSGLKNYFTEPFGKMHLVLSPQTVTSTIGIKIPKITNFLISNASLVQSISQKHGIVDPLPKDPIFLQSPDKKPPNGTLPKLEDSGIKDMLRDLNLGKSGNVLKNLVGIVQSYLLGLIERVGIHKSGVRTPVEYLRIKSVLKLKETASVWDITVPGAKCFSLENGAVVHNSNGADAFQQFGLGVREDSRDDRNKGDYGGRQPFEAETQYNLFGGR